MLNFYSTVIKIAIALEVRRQDQVCQEYLWALSMAIDMALGRGLELLHYFQLLTTSLRLMRRTNMISPHLTIGHNETNQHQSVCASYQDQMKIQTLSTPQVKAESFSLGLEVGCFNCKQCSTLCCLLQAHKWPDQNTHMFALHRRLQGQRKLKSINVLRKGFHKSVICAINGFERSKLVSVQEGAEECGQTLFIPIPCSPGWVTYLIHMSTLASSILALGDNASCRHQGHSGVEQVHYDIPST